MDFQYDSVAEVILYKAFFYLSGKGGNSSFVKKVDAAVKKARDREEWRMEYMTLLMRDRENYEQGYEQGMLHLLVSLVKEGELLKDSAAKRLNITVEQFEELMESTQK